MVEKYKTSSLKHKINLTQLYIIPEKIYYFIYCLHILYKPHTHTPTALKTTHIWLFGTKLSNYICTFLNVWTTCGDETKQCSKQLAYTKTHTYTKKTPHFAILQLFTHTLYVVCIMTSSKIV